MVPLPQGPHQVPYWHVHIGHRQSGLREVSCQPCWDLLPWTVNTLPCLAFPCTFASATHALQLRACLLQVPGQPLCAHHGLHDLPALLQARNYPRLHLPLVDPRRGRLLQVCALPHLQASGVRQQLGATILKHECAPSQMDELRPDLSVATSWLGCLGTSECGKVGQFTQCSISHILKESDMVHHAAKEFKCSWLHVGST